MQWLYFASIIVASSQLADVGESFAPISLLRQSRNFKVSSLAASSLDDLPGPEDVTEESIRSLFYLWNNALATGESRLVAKRYAKDAVLLPAVSDEPRMDYDSIKEYYDEFLKQRPQKEIIEGRIRVGYGWAEDAGICDIVLGVGDNARIRARYSFVYVWEDGRWKILHHHSSVMPKHQQPKLQAQASLGRSSSTPRMTEERVRNLFQLFNDAVDTRDVDAVSQLFSKSAIVFPTDAAKPLKSPVEIYNYLKNFLSYQPKIQMLDSYISIGPDHTSAKDMGTYELFLQSDQSKIKCRYSFDYALDSDGQWKITHHQSTPVSDSPLPRRVSRQDRATVERMYSASDTTNHMSDEDVRALFQKWNEALQKEDTREVVQRYVKNAVLVPTISDTPRTDTQGIREFYDSFLLSKPHAKSIQSFITVHNHWCKDVGVLEYTFGNSDMGQARRSVKERYSFLYVWEDGEWKIAHHQSLVLPEGLHPNAERVAGKEPTGPANDDRPKGGGSDQPAWM